MLYRRVSQHVKAQNWTAIGIDFFIVVFGVLMGLQAQQWLENRKYQQDYSVALDRVAVEIHTNLDTVEGVSKALKNALTVVNAGLDALIACEGSSEGLERAERALNWTRGTYGLKLQMSALEEITTSNRLLSQQSMQMRAKLRDLYALMQFMQREANLIEELPLGARTDISDSVALGELQEYQRMYGGVEWRSYSRPMYLNVPMSEACQNNDLIKSIHYWERWQSELVSILNTLKAEFQSTEAFLEENT